MLGSSPHPVVIDKDQPTLQQGSVRAQVFYTFKSTKLLWGFKFPAEKFNGRC